MANNFLKTQNNRQNMFNAKNNALSNVQQPVWTTNGGSSNTQQQYINDRTGNYDFDLGTTGWWNNYDTSFPNRFNDAVNQVNAAGRKQYGNDWNNIT